MTLTRLHIRFMATRLLLFEALQLLSDTDAAIWKTAVEERLAELRGAGGSDFLVESIEEYVTHLDFIRREVI